MKKALVERDALAFRKLKAAADAGKKGNYRQAVTILGELISETDAPPEAWLLLGRSFHALKEYSRALAAFNDYTRLQPESGQGYLFTGRTYLALGMAHRAVPVLRKALEKSPDDDAADIKAILGTAYLKSKNSSAAVQVLQEAVQAAPESKRIYRAYLNALIVRGMRLCDDENYQLGLQMFRFVLSNGAEAGFPDNIFLRLELGRAARETGNLKEALEHITHALKLTAGVNAGQGDRRIRWSRASILMALGKNTEARREIEVIRSHDSDVPQLPWNSELIDLFLIRSFLENGEWRKAAESCRQWLRNREDRPMIRVLYAEALRNLSDFKAAGNHLRLALKKEPKNLEFWYAAILVFWEGKDFDSLRRAIRSAKSLGAEAGIINRFTILYQTRTSEDIEGNITLLQNAIRSLGPEPELMYALAEAYRNAGLVAQARNWFRKTVQLKDTHENARLGEIAALEILIAQGQASSEAELGSLYNAYLKRWPDNVSLRRERALFLVRTFEYAKAAAELEKLLAWDTANPSLRRVLAYTYRKTGRYREAAVFLKALLKEKPRDIGLLIEYTGCLERAGAAHYAVAVLEKARALFKSSADISLALGILSFREKKLEQAFDYLREAAALDTRDPRPYEWMAVIARRTGDSSIYYAKEAEKRKNFHK